MGYNDTEPATRTRFNPLLRQLQRRSMVFQEETRHSSEEEWALHSLFAETSKRVGRKG